MRIHKYLPAAVLCLAALAPSPVHAQPANDNFASAINITSTPYTNSQTTSTATVEGTEPGTFCGGTGRSIWYRYTAPSTGSVVADLFGSSFDTVLTAFTGSSLANLVAVACNDDSGGSLVSQMPFAVQAGTTYYIRVNGYSGNAGSATLHLSSVQAPLFTQCPSIGRDSGCQFLITAENDGDLVLAQDNQQHSYTSVTYNGRLVGVRNTSGAPLCAINVYGTNAFNFTTYGMCNASIDPHPAMCPFGETEYEGPGVALEGASNNFGTVSFEPCIPDTGSAYFSLAGFTFLTNNPLYVCADDEVCGPDNDGDGLINDFDNCPNTVNVDQANLDGDSQGDACDEVDNTLVLKSAAIKQKTTGRDVIIKGSIFQSEDVVDAPDVSAGLSIAVYDQAYTAYSIDLDAAVCVESASKITCEALDGTASLQIKTSNLERGKAPFTLKLRGADVEPPPFFLGPILMVLEDTATQISRQGMSASTCITSPTKITCK